MVFERIRKGVKRKKAEAKAKKNKRQRERQKRKESFREKLEALEDFKSDVGELAGATRPAGAARAASKGVKKTASTAKKVGERSRKDLAALNERLSAVDFDVPEGELDAGQREARREREQRRSAQDGLAMGEPPPAADPMETFGDTPADQLGLDAGDQSMSGGLPEMELENDRT